MTHVRPSYAVWCIAESPEAAARVVALTVLGAVAVIYRSEAACLADWLGYPAPLAARHHPYRCGVVASPEGFYIGSTSRLV